MSTTKGHRKEDKQPKQNKRRKCNPCILKSIAPVPWTWHSTNTLSPRKTRKSAKVIRLYPETSDFLKKSKEKK